MKFVRWVICLGVSAVLLGLLGCDLVMIDCDASYLRAPLIEADMGPPRSSVVDTLRPVFEWAPTDYDCAIEGYRIRLFSAAGDRSALVTSGSTWTPDADLAPASMYAWQVAAVAPDGSEGPPSPLYYFFTGPLCSESQRWAVTLLSPAAGETVVEDSPPLVWSYPDRSCLPEGYRFTVWDVAAGNSALHGNSGPSNSFETGIPYLQDCRLYHWWIQPVIGGVASEHYIPSYFVTNFSGACPGAPCDASALAAPQPLTPLNGAAWSGSYPIVTWDYPYPACQGDMVFHAQVARDPAFNDLVTFSDTIPGGWMSFEPAAATLTDCTTYYWRVAADLGGTLGPYSETWSFVTDFSGACPSSPCNASARPAPTPLSPIDGAAWSGTYPIVTWDYPHAGCEQFITYYAAVARDPDFTDLVAYSDSIPGGYTTFDPAAAVLDDCTTYYWRVRAESPLGRGPFSETAYFRTDFSGVCGRSMRGEINRDAVCRSGPGLDYPIRLYLSRGQRVELTGRNQDATWLAIVRPDGYGQCWIGAGLLTAEDDITRLLVQDAPPPPAAGPQPTEEPAAAPNPTPPPVVCSNYTLMLACEQAGCKWQYDQQHPNGVCMNP